MTHTRLYIGDVSPSTTERQLHDLFATAGEVLSVDLAQSFAFVQMETPEAAHEAVNRYNGYALNGSRLIVYAVPPRSRSR